MNIGALLEESDGINSPIRYFYDSSNSRLLATLQNGEGVTYTYDAGGGMTSVKPATGTSSSYSAVNNAETVNYTYNSAGELTQITTESTTDSFVYDSYGNTDEIRIGNAQIAEYEYYSKSESESKPKETPKSVTEGESTTKDKDSRSKGEPGEKNEFVR